jgi:hypothetical protein
MRIIVLISVAGLFLCSAASGGMPDSATPRASNPYGVLVEFGRIDALAAPREMFTTVRDAGIG